ncbi:hypothetical protein Tsubulata_033827 [Turnera subulata]|uniref:F-box protein At3g26010-like beta-propeller domain-containing protein n=1 Tax=Turnera subulata TaxID=218843 RepID=A0A9Q0FNY4_9ROSI|nr:hypothetical protein Tsubulata_048922 [Turnera subulata]KAJ4835461.1 hypothetical protein Tsubulata_033827 [Turnera subulata]
MEGIDDALLMEILCRACSSPKFAFQCKLVCKRWESLISNPIFPSRWNELCNIYHPNRRKLFFLIFNLRIRPKQNKYMLNHVVSKPTNLLGRRKSFKLDFLPCSKQGLPASVRIAASCSNGLLLCHSIGHLMDSEPRVYYLCNPLTREWVALPPFPAKYPFMEGVAVGIVCDDKNWSSTYRVVRFHEGRYAYPFNGHRSAFIAEIFSSKTSEWEETEVWYPPLNNPSFCFLGYRSGAEYLSDNIFSCNGRLFMMNAMGIVVYNPFEPERFHIIKFPNEPHFRHIVYGESKGSFRLLANTSIGGHGCFKIWELTDYEKGEWRLINEIFFRDMDTDDVALKQAVWHDGGKGVQSLGLDPNDEHTVYFDLLIRDGFSGRNCVNHRQIFSCNLQTKKAELLHPTISQWSAEKELGRAYINVFHFASSEYWPTCSNEMPLPTSN